MGCTVSMFDAGDFSQLGWRREISTPAEVEKYLRMQLAQCETVFVELQDTRKRIYSVLSERKSSELCNSLGRIGDDLKQIESFAEEGYYLDGTQRDVLAALIDILEKLKECFECITSATDKVVATHGDIVRGHEDLVIEFAWKASVLKEYFDTNAGSLEVATRQVKEMLDLMALIKCDESLLHTTEATTPKLKRSKSCLHKGNHQNQTPDSKSGQSPIKSFSMISSHNSTSFMI